MHLSLLVFTVGVQIVIGRDLCGSECVPGKALKLKCFVIVVTNREEPF